MEVLSSGSLKNGLCGNQPKEIYHTKVRVKILQFLAVIGVIKSMRDSFKN
jgi:hypothetical protein